MTSPTLLREAAYLAGNPRFIVRTLDGPKGRKYARIAPDGRIIFDWDRNAAQLFSRPDARQVHHDASAAGMLVTFEAAL